MIIVCVIMDVLKALLKKLFNFRVCFTFVTVWSRFDAKTTCEDSDVKTLFNNSDADPLGVYSLTLYTHLHIVRALVCVYLGYLFVCVCFCVC